MDNMDNMESMDKMDKMQNMTRMAKVAPMAKTRLPKDWLHGLEDRNVAVVLAGSFGALGLVRDLGQQSIPVVVLSATEFLTKSRHSIGFVVQDEIEKLERLRQIPTLLAKKPLLFTDNDADLDLIYVRSLGFAQ